PITITAENAAAIGLKPQPGVPPNIQTVPFFIGKGDYQLNASNRLTGRYILFRNQSPYNNGPMALMALETATDFTDAMDSTAAQLVSTLGSSRLNELRVQYSHRHQSSIPNADSAPPPFITIPNVAMFGGPYNTTGQGGNGFDFKQNITQVIDNYTQI